MWGWITWDLLQPEDRHRATVQDLQWLLDQFHKTQQDQLFACLPSCCRPKGEGKVSAPPGVPMLASGRDGLKRFSMVQSPDGRFNFDEKDEDAEQLQELTQSINAKAWERAGKQFKVVLAVLSVIYFGWLCDHHCATHPL